MIGGNTGKRTTQVSDKTSFTVHQYRMVGVSHGNVSVMDYTGVVLDRLYCYICTGWSVCHMETDNTGVGLQRCRITQVSGLDRFKCIYLRDGWGSERTL